MAGKGYSAMAYCTEHVERRAPGSLQLLTGTDFQCNNTKAALRPEKRSIVITGFVCGGRLACLSSVGLSF